MKALFALLPTWVWVVIGVVVLGVIIYFGIGWYVARMER